MPFVYYNIWLPWSAKVDSTLIGKTVVTIIFDGKPWSCKRAYRNESLKRTSIWEYPKIGPWFEIMTSLDADLRSGRRLEAGHRSDSFIYLQISMQYESQSARTPMKIYDLCHSIAILTSPLLNTNSIVLVKENILKEYSMKFRVSLKTIVIKLIDYFRIQDLYIIWLSIVIWWNASYVLNYLSCNQYIWCTNMLYEYIFALFVAYE